MGKVSTDVIKNLEMGRLCWMIWVGPKCNHMYHYKREISHNSRGEGNATNKIETGVMRPQTRECQQPQEAGRWEEGILP